MADYEAQAERAATAFIVETGIRAPIESYDALHAVVAAAYLTGRHDGMREAREMLNVTPFEVKP